MTSNADLASSIFSEVRTLVDDLMADQSAGRVSVELIVFGRSVELALDFTDSLDAVNDRLAELQANPTAAVSDPEGTNLNGVINAGVLHLAQAWRRRHAESDGAVLSTGTLITITDGNDTSGATLEPIDPRFNLISVGVSSDIDDTELTRIGPHGSFLAPTNADRTEAFAKVAQRVAEYPERVYLLGYCSPAVAGKHSIEAALATRAAAAKAKCTFDAKDFGVGAGVCNATFINEYCSGGEHGCGTFLSCESCGPVPDGGTSNDAWFHPEDDGKD